MADLLRRTYLVDVLTCPICKGHRRLLAFITERESIVRILRHLGWPTEPPVVAPARPPPALALPFS
ncbi:MAG: ATP-dependent helicase HrpA [Planctomycetota bacterium]